MHYLTIWASKSLTENEQFGAINNNLHLKEIKMTTNNLNEHLRSSNPEAGIAGKISVFASSITTNFNIEIFIDGVNFSLTSTKKIQGDPPLNMAKKLGSEEGCFCHNSKSGVAIFKPHFLRLKWSKCKNFSAH